MITTSVCPYFALIATLLWGVPSKADSLILGVVNRSATGGRASFIADAQRALNTLPPGCRAETALEPDGVFGKNTRAAIKKAASCPEIQSRLEAGSDAHRGFLTEGLWKILFPRRVVPTVHERAMVVVLTNEGTDYDHAEWNFCQSKPVYDPRRGQPICYSNDPSSFLTWGPRGATAGHGKEVQQIVKAVDSGTVTRQLVDSAFRTQASSVRRLLALSDEDTKHYLCMIWLDPVTRSQWVEGFSRFGRNLQVRRVYDVVYGSEEFDGGKIKSYYKLYAELGLVPSEVDYGLFVDRATHMGGVTDRVFAVAKRQAAGLTNAALRRWMALNFRPSNQHGDRLGRDVVFYVDDLGSALSEEERTAWVSRNATRASEYGLRSSVSAPIFKTNPNPYPKPQSDLSQMLTEAERERCPSAVLSPKLPLN